MDAIKKKMEKLSNETSEAEVKKMMLLRMIMRMTVCDDDKDGGNVYDCENSEQDSQNVYFIRLRCSPQSLLPISNLTFLFQIRIAHFEDIKAANEAEAEKFEEQLRNIQKKMQVITIIDSSLLKLSSSSTP